MAKVRAGWSGEYSLTKHEFYAAYHIAMQYNDWIERYNALVNTHKGIRYDANKVQTSTNSDGVLNIVAKMLWYSDKIKMIRDTAKEADAELAPYIIKAVTNEGITYEYLDQMMNIPCGRQKFYDRRRKFYWLLFGKVE